MLMFGCALPPPVGRTLLMAAARSDDRQLVQRLLDARPIIMGPHHKVGWAPEKKEADRFS
jgi:hypothetical protein